MKKAFTIIELMISLIIFGIGIISVLIILNKNIFLSKQVEIRTKATIAAKEGIEIVFNKRDSNNIIYQKWNYITGKNDNKQYFTGGKYYKVWTDLTGSTQNIEELDKANILKNSELYIKTGSIYSNNNTETYSGFYYNYKTGNKTNLSRYINFTGANIDGDKNNDVLKLNSVVYYRFGGNTGEIIMESFISNWK